jgi:hypothetical protein
MMIQLKLQSLMVLGVCALGVAAAVILLPVLCNIKNTQGNLQPQVETNKKSSEE